MRRAIQLAVETMVATAGQMQAAPIFIQTPVVDSAVFSDAETAERSADDFSLASPGTVRTVSWRGIYFPTGTPQAVDAFTINFFSESLGAPASLLQSFNVGDAVNRTGSGEFLASVEAFDYTADLGSGIALSGGTTYWMSIFNNTTVDPDDSWWWAFNPSGGNSRYSSDGGVSFPISGSLSLYFILDNENLSAVPEPSTFALLGIGSVCMLAVGVRRRRKNMLA